MAKSSLERSVGSAIGDIRTNELLRERLTGVVIERGRCSELARGRFLRNSDHNVRKV